MATPVTSNPFTDDKILFTNKAAANTWRLSLMVPDATAGTPGVVSQMLNIPMSNLEIVLGDSTTVPIALGDFVDEMVSAGIMAPAV